MEVSHDTVSAGSEVAMMGDKVDLYAGDLKIGDNFYDLAKTAGIDFEVPENQVAVISIVPSVDTKVCEAQTHLLGESKSLNDKVARITISRDLPMAQSRFADAASLTNIHYYSDYKAGDFGRKTGLLMKGSELLARAVLVTDQNGVIKHLQVVPDISQLPNMEKAFQVANDLVKSELAPSGA